MIRVDYPLTNADWLKGRLAEQAKAATAVRASDLAWLFSPDLWLELRGVLLPRIAPLFSEAFHVGAQLAAQQRPSRRGGKELPLFEVAREMLREKFNPNHDPETGQFSEGLGGGVGGGDGGGDVAVSKAGRQMIDRVVSRYGITEDWNKAGYILPDGRMLNMRRSIQPGDLWVSGSSHHEVAQYALLSANPQSRVAITEELHSFTHETGALRFSAQGDRGFFWADRKPTAAQESTVRSILKDMRDSSDRAPTIYVELAHTGGPTPPAKPVSTERQLIAAIRGEHVHADEIAKYRMAMGQRATGDQPPKKPPPPLPILPFDFDAVNAASQNVIASYCVTPETRILTLGLEWVPAGDLREGDKIVGFEDLPHYRRARSYEPAAIVAYERRRLPVFELSLATGERIRSTGEHRWLAAESGGGHGRGVRWIRTEDMAVTRSPRLVLARYFRPWEPVDGYDAGYLAAAFDGEGSVGRTPHGSLRLDFTQKDNAMLAQVKASLARFGFEWSEYERPNGVHTLHLKGLDEADGRRRGGIQERLRFLGMFRPPRLLANYERSWFEGGQGRFGMRACDFVHVENVEYVGEREIAALSSSSRTYIAEGFGSHNTDAWWQQFSASTQRSLRKIIADAEANGYTMPQVTEQVATLFGPERAKRIAVSEITNLLGMGAQETYRQAGFISWEWATVRDAFVDLQCTLLDGQQFPMAVQFERAHVGCRCWPKPIGTPVIPAVAPYLGGPYLT